MTIQPEAFLKHGHCVTVFIWMNWTSLESRLPDFYRAYAHHLHKSPMTSIRQLEGLQAPYWTAGLDGELLVLSHITNLPTHVHPRHGKDEKTVPSYGFVRLLSLMLVKHFEILGWRMLTMKMQSYWLKEKLGRASEPSPKGEYFVLRLPFIRWGDILELLFYSTRERFENHWRLGWISPRITTFYFSTVCDEFDLAFYADNFDLKQLYLETRLYCKHSCCMTDATVLT